MVTLARGLVGAAAALGAAVWAAGPAISDDELPEGVPEGIYTYNQPGQPPSTWKITPLCVPTVGDGRVPLSTAIGCKLQVEAKGSSGGAYRLTGGKWSRSTPMLSGMTCPDGKHAATEETFQFDAASLSGTYSRAHNAVCGMQPGIDTFPFTLTFVAPLPNPTEHYPLHCQDNPQHLCS